MFNIGMPELVLILIIALVVFGPGKLPEVGKAIGRSIQEFKRASIDAMSEKEQTAKTEPKVIEATVTEAETKNNPTEEKK